MNSLLVSLSSAMIAVIICAVILICAGAAAVAAGGKILSDRKTSRKKAEAKSVRKNTEPSDKKNKAKPKEQSAQSTAEQTVTQAAAEENSAPSEGVVKDNPKAPVSVKADGEAQSGSAAEEEDGIGEAPAALENVQDARTRVESAAESDPRNIQERKTEAGKEQGTEAGKTDNKTDKFEIIKGEGGAFVRIRYNRSFTAKLIQSEEKIKSYYSQIKNQLKTYGVKERVSWRHEAYRDGRKLLARVEMRGKTLCLYCALNPADYEGTKYKVEDVSDKKRNADVPALFRIKNDRRLKYSEQIISDLMTKHNLAATDTQTVDYASQYPYEELQPLIDKKLIKLLSVKDKSADSEVAVLPVTDLLPKEVLHEVSVNEAEEILPFENVDAFIGVSERTADRTKRGIVNIDELGRYFKSGERVTLEEIKRRVPTVSKKTTYIKVLARGTLDKPLEVEADDYSPAAVKMIVLTGCKASRTK